MTPVPGQLARVRSRQYLVEEVVPPPKAGDQTLVRLSCLDDDAQGELLDVLWEREVDARLLTGASWADLARKGFDPPRLFAAYLHALEWNCVTSTDPKLLQAPFRAGIEVMAYQLEPLRKALRLPRVNLFIADDVGLGKTIEAGLIVRELLMRQKVRRIVVACPSSVVLQWRDEMEERFGLTFAVFNRDFVLDRRRERGYGVNPWTTHSRYVISHALLRDEAYAAPLRDWLGSFAPGSLLILDEAHNAAPASSTKYAIDSHLTSIIRELAPLFEHRLFLSATPHNGHSNSFAALLELLDPHRFCRGVPVKGGAKLLDAVMVRRLKRDLREVSGGFPDRKVVQIDIEGLPSDAPELRLMQLLGEYTGVRAARLTDTSKSTQAAAALVTTSLQKRLLSSIEAFARTLRVHRSAVERQERQESSAMTAQVLAPNFSLLVEPPGADDDRAELPEDEAAAEEEAQMDAATNLTTRMGQAGALRRERELLDEMTSIAENARAVPDPRIIKLVDWLRHNLCPGLPPVDSTARPATPARWNDRRVLIFTEYTDTKRYLEQQLRPLLELTDQGDRRIATFHGGMNEESREEIKAAFNADPKRHPLRILIATDAAREGVNLQNHCADLFHFDVPWNPSRMEQRNGRIDRKLQRAPEVRCHYFVFTQRPEDRVLQALVKKSERIEMELGSLSPVLERRLTAVLEGGIRRSEAERLRSEIEAVKPSLADSAVVDEELEAARERKGQLAKQLDDLRDMMEASKEHLGLTEDAFRDALSSSLQLLGAEPLVRMNGAWRFPALDQRTGADPSWAETLDTLRPRRRKDQKAWDWRRESPPRPVIFKDTGTLDDEFVHLHLEHRVAQRLLGRFLAQGFVHDDLSRASVCLTSDAIPRVVLMGRLSLYGEGASRLHDEILPLPARWTDPVARKGPLVPYAAEAGEKTLRLLETALTDPASAAVPEAVKTRLLASVDRDVSELLPLLQNAAARLAEQAVQKLRERGNLEALEMEKLLKEQRVRIEKTFRERESPQLVLEFSAEERRQLEADRRHWQKRLTALGSELEAEPARIRAAYEVKATRVEPVGLAYLWPASG